MPEIDITFTCDATPETTWNYLTDMETFATHLPGFVAYEEADETTSLWTVSIDLAMYSKEITFEVEVLEEEFPTAAFSMDPVDQPATGEGQVHFAPTDTGETDVSVTFTSEATGRMAPFLNTVIGKALERFSDRFIENLEDAPIND